MSGRGNVIILAFGLLAIICGPFFQTVRAQQPNATASNDAYANAFAKARDECKALWSDHVFDPLRSKIPLGDEKPTFPMLKNNERLKAKDKPLADLAIKTVEKCRGAYAPVFSMLPEQVNALMQGLIRKQDALIAQLYNGKITFGDYNVGINQMLGEFAEVVSGIRSSPQSSTAAAQIPKVDSQKITPQQPRTATADQPSRPAIQFHDVRIALVIGNSNYTNLPKLSNPTNDAHAVAEILQKLGYHTQLLLDASDQSIRNEVRKFAGDSNKANVAVVYYAGHGAQLNGNNYLLPIDIDIPRTEADIQFAGLKVDDLVNSIGSNTKIVFLDACRDNPALFKNIVKGRGSAPIGLAPAAASNFNPGTPGGGIFIAYATDAGAIADDGRGQHSPFTQALLRYIQKPISIDDMFSFVTRDVRLVTKNAQRPYKYASLENVVCLTPACSNTSAPVITDIVQQAGQSEADDLQIAMKTKNVSALETYLQNYPETIKRAEVLSAIKEFRRSEFTEWTLFEFGDLKYPQWIKLSSIEYLGDKVIAAIRWEPNDAARQKAPLSSYPNAAYVEDRYVYDCLQPLMMESEENLLDNEGRVLHNYKWAEPRFLNFSFASKIVPGSVAETARKIACHDGINIPAVSKKQVSLMDFDSLSSTVAGDGDLFYKLLDPHETSNDKELLFIFKYHTERPIPLPANATYPDAPKYLTDVGRVIMKCEEKKFLSITDDYYNASGNLVYLTGFDPLPSIDNWLALKVEIASPLHTLYDIACNSGEAQK